jgi:oxygen-independent coproporphyrinogen-3 oxidase
MTASPQVVPAVTEFTVLPPLALYIHLPWCVRKCPYCDFNSHAVRGEVPEREYVDALLRDLEFEAPPVAGRVIETVFLGGGTPSLFSPAAIARLLEGVRARVPLASDAEITLEANPGTVEAATAPSLARGPRLDPIGDTARFRGFRDTGVNRLSIGIQSFGDGKLKALGRIHGRVEALRAVETARAAGFENFNLDLMFGLPGQTPAQALADIRQALAFVPPHLSAYQLTIEPNTLFHARPPQLPDDDTIAVMQEEIEAVLADTGYRHYEVSAYAQPGRECRHNLNYWQFGDYLGIGAGAHGKITSADAITRRWKVKGPNDYLVHAGARLAIGGEQVLTREEAAFEFLMNALRLREGFAPSLFAARTGAELAVVHAPLEEARRRGLIEISEERVRASAHGWRFLNELLLSFLPEPVSTGTAAARGQRRGCSDPATGTS